MKKRLVILIMTVLSLGIILVGCKSEKPSDVVNTYFEQIKSGDTEQATKFIENTISQTDKDSSQDPGNSDEKNDEVMDEVMEDALKIYLSKIDAKVLSENIEGNNAFVEVEINGPNFSNMMMEVIQESIADAFSGKEVDEQYMSKSFLEKVKSCKNEVRTGKVNLIKEDKKWKIKSDDNIVNLMLGKARNQDSFLSK